MTPPRKGAPGLNPASDSRQKTRTSRDLTVMLDEHRLGLGLEYGFGNIGDRLGSRDSEKWGPGGSAPSSKTNIIKGIKIVTLLP